MRLGSRRDPLVDHLLGFGEVAGVFGLEAVVVVVVGGAGDELLEGDGAVGGEGKVFFEAEGAGEGPPARGGECGDDGGGEETGGGAFHREPLL